MATTEDQRNGAIGGLTSWANTVDREARLARLRDTSPASVAWHARKLGYDPDNLTSDQRKQAESARKLYYAQLSRRGVAARKARG